MSQRAINSEMLTIVEKFGAWKGEKCILNRDACKGVLFELDRIRKSVIRMQEKGGVVLVQDDGMDITTYALESYKQKH